MNMVRDWVLPSLPNAQPFPSGWNLPPVVVQLLQNRGITTPEAARAFIDPQLRDLHPPDLLPGAREAAALLAAAVRRRQKIVLYGDYDVDGITGVAVLWHVLRAAGVPPSFYVPHRLEEGYGLNSAAVRNLAADGAALLVTVDCGIGSVDEARVTAECGLPLIITDHHTTAGALPEAAAIVHPTVNGVYPNAALCGAGVAFKVAWALGQELSGSDRVAPAYRQILMDLLPLVALGTIADVVPLVGENRVLARHGLAMLKSTNNPGLAALLESAGLAGANVSGYDAGFKLAPRLNAAGRMGHARLAVEMLTRADAGRAKEIALYLEEHNRARQTKERSIFRAACEMIEERRLDSDAVRGIVLASDKWHAGVIGIVASRIVERYCRPTVLIAVENEVGQGSARSIPPFHMYDALAACGGHLLQFGGHAMAAGLRVDIERLDAFTKAFTEVANTRLTGADIRPKLRLDAEVSLEQLDLSTVQAMLNLGPFGPGNPTPRLSTGWVELAGEPRCVGKGGEHLSATFQEGSVRLRSIGFGKASLEQPLKETRRCRLAFEPMINDFNNHRTVEMQVLDMQFPSAANGPAPTADEGPSLL